MCSFEVRQLRSRQSKPDRACGSWFAINESARRERLDHLVHDGWRDAEELLKIGFGRRPSMDLRVVVDEREILSLLRRERSEGATSSRCNNAGRSPSSGDSGRVGFPDILRRPVHLADPSMPGIVNQLAADHVLAVYEDDGLVLRRDLGKRRLLVHAQIAKTQSPAGIHVVKVCVERDHEGFQRSSLGTGLGSATLRIASNCCGVKP
jgi:hypothetical protein